MSSPEGALRTTLPWHQAVLGAVRGGSLSRTIPAATAVGSTLFMVNLYSAVHDGPFTWTLAGQIALTFLVPWLNATLGIAIGLRSASSPAGCVDAQQWAQPHAE
ncbi:MAG TPA: hypothetical protein VH166_07355 [Mycobacterium sp.]|nr:hypothetical protein [Mycobacterium sp.]